MRDSSGSRLDRADLVSLLIAGGIVAGTLIAPFMEGAGLFAETSVCLSQRIAGVECPGCGMTRSVVALGRGEIERAFHVNWVAPVMFLIALAHLVARVAEWLDRVRDLRMFDLGTIVAIIAILIARSVQIWA